MPHWRTEAKENARRVRHNKVMLEALRDCVAIIAGDLSGPAQVEGVLREARAVIELVEANSTEPVE